MKGWKTIIFNVLMAILLIVDKVGGDLGLSPEIMTLVAVVGNFILRFFTDTKVASAK